jgi:dipeptidyl aminopeptidase/acylaminoacyl peptidase
MSRISRWFLIPLFAIPTFVGCGSKHPAVSPEEVTATPAEPQGQAAPAEPIAADRAADARPTDADTAADTLPAQAPASNVPPQDAAAAPAAQPSRPGAGAEPTSSIKLIPRTTLFGNPDKASVRLSPDGSKLSYLAPSDGVLNVFVGSVDNPDAAKPVTQDKLRGIRSYFWAYDSQHILYVQDTNGDEDWHVYSVDLAPGDVKDLTPLKRVSAQIENVSDRFPQEILVGLNNRDPRYHDVYRINIATGERKLIEKNTDFAGFVSDDDYQVRIGMKMTPDGGTQVYQADGKGGWQEYQKIPLEDTLTTSPAGFDKTGKVLYMTDSRGRDTSALAQIDLASGAETVLASNDLSDVGEVLVHPTEKNIQAATFNYERRIWQILDPAIKEDMRYLHTVADGDLEVLSRTLDDKTWAVAYVMDNGPVRYYLYDRTKKEARFLFTNRRSLQGLPLARMHPHVIKSRDGLNLVSYFTLPIDSDPDNSGRPKRPLPMVLLVHGGPWGRDAWSYTAEHQLLANRGYAVLSTNFRGSTGLGKNFANAGNKEWGGKMHDDLLDAVDWAIAEKIADPKRVAVMGASYGGYATLVALTSTPEVFACGVDIVGPSNLLTLLKTIPAYWAPMLQMFKDRVGDPTTEDGKKLLNDRSPLNFVDKIQRPLLIGQGSRDPRVKKSESDQIVQAMQAKHIPLTYVLFPDEGHGFARPENSLAFYAVAEAFLATQLGGRHEPFDNAFAGSKITVPQGSDQIPGLAEALKKHAAEKATGDAR